MTSAGPLAQGDWSLTVVCGGWWFDSPLTTFGKLMKDKWVHQETQLKESIGRPYTSRVCGWPIWESLYFKVNQWKYKDWFIVRPPTPPPPTPPSYLEDSSTVTWTILCRCTKHWQNSKKVVKFWATQKFLQLLIKPRKHSLAKMQKVFLPRPVEEWNSLLRQLKHKPAPGSSTNTCDRPPTWLSKMGKVNMRVLNTSQTVGIDYHLFKSETKVGQLQ